MYIKKYLMTKIDPFLPQNLLKYKFFDCFFLIIFKRKSLKKGPLQFIHLLDYNDLEFLFTFVI